MGKPLPGFFMKMQTIRSCSGPLRTLWKLMEPNSKEREWQCHCPINSSVLPGPYFAEISEI
jgi:hypothetical protein